MEKILAELGAYFEAELAKLGVTKIHIHYEGSGDSGGAGEITVNDGEISEDRLPHISVMRKAWKTWTKMEDGTVQYPIELTQLTAQNFLDEVADEIIDHFGHRGFENNEGGEGDITLTFVEGGVEVSIEHTDFFEQDDEEENVTLTSDDLDDEADAVVALCYAIKESGEQGLIVDFEGSGDSGSTTSVYLIGKPGEGKEFLQKEISSLVKHYHQKDPESKTQTVEDWAGHVADAALEMSFAGWENNGGARGEVKILADGTIEISLFSINEDAETTCNVKTFMFADLEAEEEGDDE